MNLNLNLLILSDVDADSAISLAEHFVPQSPPPFDAIVLCGPLSHMHISSAEEEAVATGDMSSVIAHLENIVCRVLYVPADQDPVKSATQQLSLTPNSVNLHARSLPLSSSLCISGFTEKVGDLTDTECTAQHHTGDDDDSDAAGMQLQSSSCATAVEQVLSSSGLCCFPGEATANVAGATASTASTTPPPPPPPAPSTCTSPFGIFVFNYKFAHSLNHFLFFQTDVALKARLRLLVIPSFADSNFVFPKSHSGYAIASPRSLRLLGGYTTAKLSFQEGSWMVDSVQDHILESICDK